MAIPIYAVLAESLEAREVCSCRDGCLFEGINFTSRNTQMTQTKQSPAKPTPSVSRAVPDSTPLRIASVLNDKPLRDELASMAAEGNLTHKRYLGASTPLLADLLSNSPRETQVLEFFGTRALSEAIVMATGRPVLFVRDGVIETARSKEWEKLIKPSRAKLKGPVGSVGRIELHDHDTMDWCGTGWRLEDDLILTNRHVAMLFGQRQGNIFQFRTNQSGKPIGVRIDFREEHKIIDSDEHVVVEILYIAPDVAEAPDLAILKVKSAVALPEPLKLATKDPKAGDVIGVVGYPAYDGRNDGKLMSELFGDIYDVKRFAPGRIMAAPTDGWHCMHDATTLGGNSGSAVLSMDSGELVGLHFAGHFRKANYAVRPSVINAALARKSWVPVTHKEWGVITEAFTEKKRTIAQLKDRKGFEVDFLGIKVAIPKPGHSHHVAAMADGNTELRYMHFSVLHSEARRLPIITAVNIDGAKKIKLKRKDSWGFDPRIAKKLQVGHDEFYYPEPFDKGHLVRREDPGWGDLADEAQMGEDDSFVYTNAVPQMPQLNQRAWLSLEDYVLSSAVTHGLKACVFTGPVFRPSDPKYSGVAVPMDFWKVIAMLDADTKKLLVSAYMLTQDGMLPAESAFRYGPFKTYQVPLSKVEKDAGIAFSKSIRSADVFSDGVGNEAFQSGRFCVIEGADDVILSRNKS